MRYHEVMNQQTYLSLRSYEHLWLKLQKLEYDIASDIRGLR